MVMNKMKWTLVKYNPKLIKSQIKQISMASKRVVVFVNERKTE